MAFGHHPQGLLLAVHLLLDYIERGVGFAVLGLEGVRRLVKARRIAEENSNPKEQDKDRKRPNGGLIKSGARHGRGVGLLRLFACSRPLLTSQEGREVSIEHHERGENNSDGYERTELPKPGKAAQVQQKKGPARG